jgi:hypothetical protein
VTADSAQDKPSGSVNGLSSDTETEEPNLAFENRMDGKAESGNESKLLGYLWRKPLSNERETAVSGASEPSIDSENRFAALVRDRDSLRAEVIQMRKSLEKVQLKHQEDMGALQQKLDESESKKEHAETQFQKLLERVNTIKSQLGQRLKEDAVCFLPMAFSGFSLTLCVGGTSLGKFQDPGVGGTEFEFQRATPCENRGGRGAIERG